MFPPALVSDVGSVFSLLSEAILLSPIYQYMDVKTSNINGHLFAWIKILLKKIQIPLMSEIALKAV